MINQIRNRSSSWTRPWQLMWLLPYGCALIVAVVLMWSATPARAVTHLSRGDEAPPITLSDLDGRKIATEKMKGRIVVLVFGELYHEKTLQACRDIAKLLTDERLQHVTVVPVLIVAQRASNEVLRAQAKDEAWPKIILHDVERTAYETYRVTVLPSVVVVDDTGHVVHAMAAYTARFPDLLTDAVLLAAGMIKPEQFDRTLSQEAPVPVGEDVLRADRLTHLADQLVRRGLNELAAEKYEQALALVPDHVAAHLGLGTLNLHQRHLPGAEAHFQVVLSKDPASVDASLGMAMIHVLRGAEELPPAETLVRRVLADHPDQPRAHYLLGLISEQQGNTEQAVASFKRAAELLMEQAGQEASP